MGDEYDELNEPYAGGIEEKSWNEGTHLIDYEALIKNHSLDEAAEKIIEGTFEESDFMKMDSVDRFLEFVYDKIQTGNIVVENMAYPAKRMSDDILEKKIIELINDHLFPEIVLKLLKFFTRNLHDPDTNLYLARLVESDEIIGAIFQTFKLFRGDVFHSSQDQRTLNVKRIQQFSPKSELDLSSPLDAAARLKYILEYLLIIRNVSHIYGPEDIKMSSGQ